jgi:hypothetical protein
MGSFRAFAAARTEVWCRPKRTDNNPFPIEFEPLQPIRHRLQASPEPGHPELTLRADLDKA